MSLRIEFKPQDLWVGVYWSKSCHWLSEDEHAWQYDAWLCLVPMFPLHVRWVQIG